jgi:dTDP-4-dehydrorhamnose reductase
MAWRANGRAPGILAAEMASLGGRLVHVSTDFVFDGSLSRPYRPDDAVSPIGVYGISKRAGEEAVLSTSDGFLVVRTGWVYSHTGANFLRTMLRIMNDRGEVNVVSDQVGTPTSARNLAAALWALADSPAAGILHFSDAGVASWYDFAQAIAEEAIELGMLPASVGVTPILAKDYPTAAKRPAYSVLDKSLTWSLLTSTGQHWRQALRFVLKDLRGTNDA